MRIPRIFHPDLIVQLGPLALSDDAAGHVARVLRMQVGQEVLLFDGSGAQFPAILSEVTKKGARVDVQQRVEHSIESPLNLHLGQVISRGDKMEFTIQKSVELGVNTITPLISERCGVKLDAKRFEKKLAQWQKIAISACEQCRSQYHSTNPPDHEPRTMVPRTFDRFKAQFAPQSRILNKHLTRALTTRSTIDWPRRWPIGR